MKIKIKHWLSELGLLPKIDLLRRLPETMRWVAGGCSGTAPPPVKRMVVSSYLERFHLGHFIETGTHLGDTLADVARNGSVACTSIELSDAYFHGAAQRFRNYPNVMLKHGDSAAVLPECVRGLQTPALFWLDGHYSGGNTARGGVDTPVSAELSAILDSPIKAHVILIDDARCFDGTNTYPCLEALLHTIRQSGHYDIEVSADIIRLTPKKAFS
jgi:hypothetical protein